MHVPLCLTVWGSLEIDFFLSFSFFGSGHDEHSDQWCHWENAQTQPVEGIGLCARHGHEHVEQRMYTAIACYAFFHLAPPFSRPVQCPLRAPLAGEKALSMAVSS